MFLLTLQRDPHTVCYIEDFLQTPNLLNYHGTGALNATLFPTWDSVFLHLMDEPKSKIKISARRRGRNRRGFNLGNDQFMDRANSENEYTRYTPKKNPYLEDRFVEYNIDIDPMNLSSRYVSTYMFVCSISYMMLHGGTSWIIEYMYITICLSCRLYNYSLWFH